MTTSPQPADGRQDRLYSPGATGRPMRLRRVLLACAALAGMACSGTAWARAPVVEVSDAWVRPAYQLPSGTGVYMSIVARRPLRLTGARSAAAGAATLSGTRVEEGVMLMHDLPAGVELPAGQPVVLAPGGDHIILERLKRPLVSGGAVVVRLEFTDAQGRRIYRDVRAPVRLVAPGQPLPAGHSHGAAHIAEPTEAPMEGHVHGEAPR